MQALAEQCEGHIAIHAAWFATSYRRIADILAAVEHRKLVEQHDPYLAWVNWCKTQNATHREPLLDLQRQPLKTVIERAKYLAIEHPTVEAAVRDWECYEQYLRTSDPQHIRALELQKPGFVKQFFERITFHRLFTNGLWKRLGPHLKHTQRFPSFNSNRFHRETLKETISEHLKDVDFGQACFAQKWHSHETVRSYAEKHLELQCKGVLSRFQETLQRRWATESEQETKVWLRRIDVVVNKVEDDQCVYETQYDYQAVVRSMVTRFQELLTTTTSSMRHPTTMSMVLTEYESKVNNSIAEMKDLHHLRTEYTIEQTQNIVEFNGCKVALHWIEIIKQFLPSYITFLTKCRDELLPKTREMRQSWTLSFESDLVKLLVKYENLLQAFTEEGNNIQASLTVQQRTIDEWREPRREHAVVLDNMMYQRDALAALILALPHGDVASNNQIPANWANDVKQALQTIKDERVFTHDMHMQAESEKEASVAQACQNHAKEERMQLLRVFQDMTVDTKILVSHLTSLRTWVSPYSEMDIDARVESQNDPPPWNNIKYVVTHEDHANLLMNVRNLWNEWQQQMTGRSSLLAAHRTAAKDIHSLIHEKQPRGLAFYWKIMPALFEVQACVSVFK